MSEYPCPHGCTTHTVPSLLPTACGHYHSPSEWGHHEQKHNSEYWQAISNGAKRRPATANQGEPIHANITAHRLGIAE